MSVLAAPSPDYDSATGELRALHFRDARVVGQRTRRRRLQNFMHAYRPDRPNRERWVAAQLGLVDLAGSSPYGWVGALDMRWALGGLDSPLHTFASDSELRWGLRRSDVPGAWVNFQLIGASLAGVVPSGVNHSATYALNGLACFSHLRVRANGHTASKVLRGTSMPSQLSDCPRFAALQPQGATFDIVDESILVFRDENGDEYIRTRPVSGWWVGDEDGPDSEGGRSFRCRIVETAPISVGSRMLRTFRIVPVAEDVAAYPGGVFYLDPTATISGTSAIDDAWIISGTSASNNNGAAVTIQIRASGGTTFRRALVRVNSGLPSNYTSIVAFNWLPVQTGVYVASTIDFHRVRPGRPWGEGDNNATPADAGECSWLVYASPNNWTTSGAGDTTSDIYTLDFSHALPGSAPGSYSISLPTTWAENSGALMPQGFLVKQNNEGIDRQVAFYSTEGASPMSFSVEYLTQSIPLFFFDCMR